MDNCIIVRIRTWESMNYGHADGKKRWDMGLCYAKCHIRHRSIYLVHSLPFNIPSDLFEAYD